MHLGTVRFLACIVLMDYFLPVSWKWSTPAIAALSALLWAQSAPAGFPVGQVIPKVSCSGNEKQSYALYLPSSFAANRQWPIIYVFDPGARGAVAVETIRAAAEKYGYIVLASNNSKNGPQGGSSEAAQAMWQDSEQRFPIAEERRYFAGMSGGARVAASLALACHGCVAGVIANAAGFPDYQLHKPDVKFAYFAAVGNADMNYPEFVALRPTLDSLGARYCIRVFAGGHGWAPPEVWSEALNWMDLQAMASGLLPRDPQRIAKTFSDDLARARALEAQGEWLAALREYAAITRDFAGLADTTIAKNRLLELQKSKDVAKQEKQEKEDLAEQNRLMSEMSRQMQAIGSGNPDRADLMDLRDKIAGLKRQADRASHQRDKLVLQRALGGLVIEAWESAQRSMEQKDYAAALQFFGFAAAGSDNLGWLHYQRARVFAGKGDKKQMLAELRQSLSSGFHSSSALDATEFAAYRQDPQFQSVASDWKKAAGQ